MESRKNWSTLIREICEMYPLTHAPIVDAETAALMHRVLDRLFALPGPPSSLCVDGLGRESELSSNRIFLTLKAP